MRPFAAAILLAALAPLAAIAEGLVLTPASPQPNEAELKPGLAVDYTYPPEVRTLREARQYLEADAAPGPPLIGFDYPDTRGDETALTSRQATRVAARISGYIRFDEPGSYDLEFESNDGLSVTIGGQEVSRYDGRHPCESGGFETVTVPSAGWYALEAVYFQRLSTSCLLMKWGASGSDLGWTPNDVFAH